MGREEGVRMGTARCLGRVWHPAGVPAVFCADTGGIATLALRSTTGYESATPAGVGEGSFAFEMKVLNLD
jgi:hypothetical protein